MYDVSLFCCTGELVVDTYLEGVICTNESLAGNVEEVVIHADGRWETKRCGATRFACLSWYGLVVLCCVVCVLLRLLMPGFGSKADVPRTLQ